MDEDEDVLIHFGVKGMKWGQRKSYPGGASHRTNREAKKDATEFSRAKMYYGQGAGVRRRLIKNTVESKSKDPTYKAAFEHHLANQDMAKRASEARGKRKRTDAVNNTKKTVRGGVHILNGNARYASAAATVVVGGALYAHKTGVDKALYNHGKTAAKAAVNSPAAKAVADLLKNWKG